MLPFGKRGAKRCSGMYGRKPAIRNYSCKCYCLGVFIIYRLFNLICIECSITCHAKCTHLVPDFCGMTMKRASEMIDQIQRAASFKSGNNKVGPIDNYPPQKELPSLQHQSLPSSPRPIQQVYNQQKPYPSQGPNDNYNGQLIQAQAGHVPVISSPVVTRPPQGIPYQQNMSIQQPQVIQVIHSSSSVCIKDFFGL